MRIGFITFEGMTALDFVGMYDTVTRLGTMGFVDPIDWAVCARSETIRTKAGLQIVPDVRPDTLEPYDMVLVPGGLRDRSILENRPFLDWLATAGDAEMVASVCTGSLLLGAAGLLDGRRATTHPDSRSALEAYCTVVPDRIVDDGDVITAGGVSSSIDLGLYIVERVTDAETRRAIATQMDYPHYRAPG